MCLALDFLSRADVKELARNGDIKGIYGLFLNERPTASFLLTDYMLEKGVLAEEILESLGRIPINCFADVHLHFVTIPSHVKTISKGAFSGCKELKAVYFANPTTLTSIGDYSFRGCASLERINIPPTVTAIGYEAFMGCGRLKEITLPEGIVEIRDGTFSGCSALKEVILPSTVTTIGYKSFGECQGLTAVHIPQSVRSIDHSAFLNCSQLQDIYYDGTKDDWQRVKKGVANNWLKKAKIHFAK